MNQVSLKNRGPMAPKTKRPFINKKNRNFLDRKKMIGLSLDAEIFKLEELRATFDSSKAKNFEEYPLSKHTHQGLKLSGFIEPTQIQKESIGLALKGVDILGAAKTGSGKTLAFLIPVLETLFKQKWSNHDGLGALIITPTRELAYQIYEVLKKCGQKHDFSAGLVIGGKDLKYERQCVYRCNIIICTPGRLLQHMEENYTFSCDKLQILVLDEADRILDMGFKTAMNAIITYLPEERQTLLFSATQTKSVQDLARLSLKDPVYVSVHEHSVYSTPELLNQSYVVCELHEKLDLLSSFIVEHNQYKILVFVSTCKQAKYMNDAFHYLFPRRFIRALYGGLHQTKRTDIFDQFCKTKSAILFATDLAARGLDFPAVHWVIHLDCPEDPETYIHRAGRTARYQSGGESLLVLLPSEENAMVELLKSKKVPINRVRVDPQKIRTNCEVKLRNFIFKNPEFKEIAQRAFMAYMKSVFLMKNKKVFDVCVLDEAKFALSLGLGQAPTITMIEKAKQRRKVKQQKLEDEVNEKNKQQQEEKLEDELKVEKIEQSEDESEFEEETLKEINEKPQKRDLFGVVDDDDDLFTLKKVHLPENDLPKDEISSKPKRLVTKIAAAKKLLKRNVKPSTKIIFDEDGQEVIQGQPKKLMSEGAKKLLAEDDEICGINIEKSKQIMKEEDKIDKELYRQRVKDMHKKKRLKEKELRRGKARDKETEDPGIQLGGYSDEDDENSSEFEDSEENSIQDGDDSEASFDESDENIEESDDESDVHPPKKRKVDINKLSLAVTEELALRALGNLS